MFPAAATLVWIILVVTIILAVMAFLTGGYLAQHEPPVLKEALRCGAPFALSGTLLRQHLAPLVR